MESKVAAVGACGLLLRDVRKKAAEAQELNKFQGPLSDAVLNGTARVSPAAYEAALSPVDTGVVDANATEAAKRKPPRCFVMRYQPEMRAIYASVRVQVFVAGLIVINFGANIIEKEVDPQGVLYPSTWKGLEHSFNAIFLAELIVNMYSYWFCQFWVSGWNVFDFSTVSKLNLSHSPSSDSYLRSSSIHSDCLHSTS